MSHKLWPPDEWKNLFVDSFDVLSTEWQENSTTSMSVTWRFGHITSATYTAHMHCHLVQEPVQVSYVRWQKPYFRHCNNSADTVFFRGMGLKNWWPVVLASISFFLKPPCCEQIFLKSYTAGSIPNHVFLHVGKLSQLSWWWQQSNRLKLERI